MSQKRNANFKLPLSTRIDADFAYMLENLSNDSEESQVKSWRKAIAPSGVENIDLYWSLDRKVPAAGRSIGHHNLLTSTHVSGETDNTAQQSIILIDIGRPVESCVRCNVRLQ